MNGEIINLRQIRKRQKRAEAEQQAKENRALYGRPSREKKTDTAEKQRADKIHEQHRLSHPVGRPGKEDEHD